MNPLPPLHHHMKPTCWNQGCIFLTLALMSQTSAREMLRMRYNHLCEVQH